MRRFSKSSLPQQNAFPARIEVAHCSIFYATSALAMGGCLRDDAIALRSLRPTPDEGHA
jgi:hypothetical protein